MGIYEDNKALLSRKATLLVVITLDFCDLTHGIAPCTATQTGDAKCCNTRNTSNDPDNYTNTTGKEYKFSLRSANNPLPGQIVRPYLTKWPKFLSTEIDPKTTITQNASITLEFEDEPDNDIAGRIDKYASDRSAYPNAPGTFWRKLMARNQYYRGRTIEIKDGFEGMDEADYNVRKYQIDSIDILKNGRIKLIAKDILKQANRKQIPKASSGEVTDDPLTAGAGTINYSTPDITDYPSPTTTFYIRIDDEIIECSANNTGTGQMTVANRGIDIGNIVTSAAQHEVGAKIQLCYVKFAINGVDILLDVYENEVGIDVSEIKVSEFESERDTWLAAYTFTGIISEPMEATKVINELLENMGANSWWSEEEQLIRFKTSSPPILGAATGLPILTHEDSNVSISRNNNEISRVSRTIIYYNKEKLDDEKEAQSYFRHKVSKDSESEGADQYDEETTRSIFSRWIITGAIASSVASRFHRRFRNPPIELKVINELKDSIIRVGDLPVIETDFVIDTGGVRITARQYQILRKKQLSLGTFEYIGLDSVWNLQYAVIAPAGFPDWDSATDAQKRYAFIADAGGTLGVNEDPPFYIF